MRRSRTTCRPRHFPRVRGTKGGLRRGQPSLPRLDRFGSLVRTEPSGFPRGECVGRRPAEFASCQASGKRDPMRQARPNEPPGRPNGNPEGRNPLGSVRTVRTNGPLMCLAPAPCIPRMRGMQGGWREAISMARSCVRCVLIQAGSAPRDSHWDALAVRSGALGA